MLVLAVIAAMLADLLTFVCAVTVFGAGPESNPLARMAYEAGGLAGVALLKLAGMAGALVILSLLTGRLRTWSAAAAIVFTLLAAGTNTLAVALFA